MNVFFEFHKKGAASAASTFSTDDFLYFHGTAVHLDVAEREVTTSGTFQFLQCQDQFLVIDLEYLRLTVDDDFHRMAVGKAHQLSSRFNELVAKGNRRLGVIRLCYVRQSGIRRCNRGTSGDSVSPAVRPETATIQIRRMAAQIPNAAIRLPLLFF